MAKELSQALKTTPSVFGMQRLTITILSPWKATLIGYGQWPFHLIARGLYQALKTRPFVFGMQKLSDPDPGAFEKATLIRGHLSSLFT